MKQKKSMYLFWVGVDESLPLLSNTLQLCDSDTKLLPPPRAPPPPSRPPTPAPPHASPAGVAGVLGVFNCYTPEAHFGKKHKLN